MQRKPLSLFRIPSRSLLGGLLGFGFVVGDLSAAEKAEADKEQLSYWAYETPTRPPVPRSDDPFIRNPIDAFVLEGLESAGLRPNPEAPSNHLIRRAFYDLSGLPPTLKEIEDFCQVSDQDAACEVLVDKLLSSNRFGEKLASLWLDVVRYAETNAFERDTIKPFIWRYRDYVISAFNENKPYDRFVVEQLAGDELPNSDKDANVATGFMVLMQRDDEPADHEQAHSDMISDIVDVSGEAFLGTTMGCAKCHDHKADPILQSDYYSMMSFFDTIALSHLKSANKAWYDDEEELERERSEDAIAVAWKTVDTGRLDEFVKRSESPEAMIRMGYVENETRESKWQIFPELPEDPRWTFPSYQPVNYEEGLAPFSTDDNGFHVVFRSKEGKLPSKEIDYTSLPHVEKPLVLRKEFRLVSLPEQLIFYAQGRLLTDIDIFFNGVEVYSGEAVFRGAYLVIPFNAEEIGHLTTGKNIISIVVHPKDPKHGYWFDPGFYFNAVTPLPVNDLVVLNPDLIEDIYGEGFRQTIEPLVEERNHIFENPGKPYFSVNESRQVPAARIHLRGNVHAAGEEVPLAFPAVLRYSDSLEVPTQKSQDEQYKRTGTTGRRLAIAEWLTHPENPLTARVMVNRLWQHCFGFGLVPSANDFGVLGEGVSNQALLDWLAVEFVESGWDIKHMLRLMMTSSTYRMSVEAQTEALSVDPQNRLHWRHNARRLTAEEIWDTFLLLQGDLNLEMFGEWVRPKMPEAVLAGSSQPHSVWRETIGEAANRRAIYIHVKRSIQLPLLAAFDAPQRDATCPTRFATTVPTQALSMLNSERVNKVAKAFADRVSAEHDDLVGQVEAAYEIALGRQADAGELELLFELCADLEEEYEVDDSSLLARICLILLNLNETIYLD